MMAERAEMSISAMFLYANMLIFRMLGLMIRNPKKVGLPECPP
jgi:hypothetical protein